MDFVNLALEESDFGVAIIHVGENDLLSCQDDINQINNILRNIEHIVQKCKYGVRNIFISGVTITDRLLEQLIKDFNISICNIRNRTPNCDYIDNANIELKEVRRYGLHLSGKGKYALTNDYLDKVCKFF